MNNEIIQIQLKASMDFTALQWRNQTRMFFERWAMIIASDHCVLLENLSRSDKVYNWYLSQFWKAEQEFYNRYKDYIINLNCPNELFDLFTEMAHEIEDYYPITLIQNLKHGKTAIN